MIDRYHTGDPQVLWTPSQEWEVDHPTPPLPAVGSVAS